MLFFIGLVIVIVALVLVEFLYLEICNYISCNILRLRLINFDFFNLFATTLMILIEIILNYNFLFNRILRLVFLCFIDAVLDRLTDTVLTFFMSFDISRVSGHLYAFHLINENWLDKLIVRTITIVSINFQLGALHIFLQWEFLASLLNWSSLLT